MSWYAVRALDEALSETHSLLLPFDFGVWVRLAFIALFAGLSTPQTPTVNWNVPTMDVGFGEFAGVDPGSIDPGALSPRVTTALLLFAAAVVVAGVLFALAGAVMEFVLVRALRSRSVRIVRPFRNRFGSGLRLFAFRILVAIFGLVAFALVAVPVAFAALTGNPVWLLALVVTVPLLVVVGVLVAAVLEFTTAFVVPLMDEHRDGVFTGWRRLWPTLRTEWQQFGVYVLVKIVLLVGVGFVVGLALAVVFVPLAFLVGAAGFLGSMTVSNATAPAVLALIAATIVGIIALAAVSVPVVTYLRYHSLCTLAASGAEFELR
jgi:MFS family permease